MSDLEEDDLDLVYLKVAGTRVVLAGDRVYIVLRVAQVGAVRSHAAAPAAASARRQRRRRRLRRQRRHLASACRTTGTCHGRGRSGGRVRARPGREPARHARLDVILGHIHLQYNIRRQAAAADWQRDAAAS